MRWIKKGLIYKPNGRLSWSKTHAQIPTPTLINPDVIRIYFSTRDDYGCSRVGYIDLDSKKPQNIIDISNKPVLEVGEPGLHDDSGTMPFSVINDNEGCKLYYTGWHIPKTVSYDLSVALALSDNNNFFYKFSKGPLFSKNIYEPYWAAAPCVIKDLNQYKMWYISCYGWVKSSERLEPVYQIKYACSQDGINWDLNNEIAIKPKYKNEALGRPWVLKVNGMYRMWYSTRGSNLYRQKNGEHYMIGYADSEDGVNWIRKDEEVGICLSNTGWDSEMIEYCSIIKVGNKYLMFYNGNCFGKTGFGYAELDYLL